MIHKLPHKYKLSAFPITDRQAAEGGHPGGAYNLVAGHLQGYKTDLQEQ